MAESPFRYRSRTRRETLTPPARLVGNVSSWREVFVGGEIDQEPMDSSIVRRPLFIWFGLVAAVSLVFVLQLFNLQIVQGERYAGLADGNRLRSTVTYAARGKIYDRHGRVLATNTASYQLTVQPHLLPTGESRRQAVFEQVAALTGRGENEIREQAETTQTGIEPLVVIDRLSRAQALNLEETLPQLPGFAVDAIPVRDYTSDSGLAHIVGYTGRVTEEELGRRDDLLPIDFVGKDGVELMYDQRLRGTNGIIRTEVDASGQPIRVLFSQSATAGEDITLTIDAGLQRRLAAALRAQMKEAGVVRAAGVALNPKTGEVLASVSLPSFDNNLFARGISADQYQQLVSNPLEPLHNKVIGGGYPAGSIIKPMHVSAALQEGVVNEDTVIVDRGKIVLQSPYDPSATFVFRGWRPEGLGPMNARRAVAMSSDIYFYTTGGGFGDFKGLGVDRLTRYYRLFGLGERTGIDLPGEASGRVPTPQWLEKNYDRPWSVGDTYNISIGQGDLLTSPLQMAVSTAAVANGGHLLEPYVVKPSQGASARVVREGFIDKQYLKIAREGMRAVIGGTTCTCTFADVAVTVAGKSGTAETDPGSNRQPHAWYTAFAPYEDPEIVFAVLLEEGEGGSQFAAPVIADALKWYFDHR